MERGARLVGSSLSDVLLVSALVLFSCSLLLLLLMLFSSSFLADALRRSERDEPVEDEDTIG